MRRVHVLLGTIGAAAVMVLQVGAAAPAAVASDSPTCSGGSVAAGTYASLRITGACAVDSGAVHVLGNLEVANGAALYAAFGGSELTVGKNLSVNENAVLVLGCEPQAFICFNDPNQEVGTLSTNDRIGGSLVARNALAVLVHHSKVGLNIAQTGGGGGVNCSGQNALFGSPAYATYEDVSVGGTVWITGWQSCWLGFFRNQVGGSVNFNNNVTADPDGNEVATNEIRGSLNCTGNSPDPQIGDSGGALNHAARGTGQCEKLVVH
jgi:hypothetical protein